MDFYHGVVLDYLRADRAIFLNTECCIQLKKAVNPDKSGPHWYCDAVACDFRTPCIYLCEFSYSRQLGSLLKRLKQWNDNWQDLRCALTRDCCITADWSARPWLFVPVHLVELLVSRLQQMQDSASTPKITTLEMVQPWKYKSWDRQGEDCKEKENAGIPPEMR